MRSLKLTDFGQPLEWSETPVPEPTGTEVLLETLACGVCHSDLHLWEGYYDLGGGRRSYVKDRGFSLPRTLGHEVVGRVVASGPEASAVAVGDTRLVYPWIGCGDCRECGEGATHVCERPRSIGVFADGGYSDHILVSDARFLVDIGDLDPGVACSYACAGLTAYSALRKALPLESGDTLVVIGAGGLGLMALQLVRELTDARVVVLDVDDRKLEAARQLGDWATVNTASDSVRERLREAIGRGGARAIVDFVGSSDTSMLGFSLLAKNGTLITVGLFGGELTIPTPALPLKNVTLRGSYTGTLAELEELISLVRAGRLRPIPTCDYPLSEAGRLLERVRAGDLIGRAVLRPELASSGPPAESVSGARV